MKTICLYFEIHQIIHLKRYRCFDIGTDHYYYDDYENERSITEIAERSYIPALTTLLEISPTLPATSTPATATPSSWAYSWAV